MSPHWLETKLHTGTLSGTFVGITYYRNDSNVLRNALPPPSEMFKHKATYFVNVVCI